MPVEGAEWGFIDRLVENELSLVSSLENENQEEGERVCEVHPTHAVSPKSESAANQAYPLIQQPRSVLRQQMANS